MCSSDLSRWSKTSLILQKEEKAKTPNKEDKAMLSTNRQVTIPASPRKRKNHQQTHAEIIFGFDHDRVEEADDEEGTDSDDQSVEMEIT